MKQNIFELECYLVGGAVRDIYMGNLPSDHDYVVIGSTPEEMLSLGFTQVGADFPVFLHPETKEEYALARRERKTGAGYLGFECDFGTDVTLVEDLGRRDLTCNSMAMALDGTGRIIDPFNGRVDINNRVIRVTSDAFSEDPLRVLRMVRFAARYNWSIDQASIDAAKSVIDSGALNELPSERFWKELEKVIDDEKLPNFFITFHQFCGLGKINFFNNALPNGISVATSWRIDAINTVEDMSALMSDQNTTIWPTLKAAKISKALALGLPMNTEKMYSFLVACDAFRMSSIVDDVVRMYNDMDYKQAKYIAIANSLCKTVTVDMFHGITGKALGDAIAEKRKQLISCIFS